MHSYHFITILSIVFAPLKAIDDGMVLEICRLSPSVPCIVHCITIDPQKRSISLEPALGSGYMRESVLCMVTRTKAYAGINANNYRRGGAFNGNAVDVLKIKALYTDPCVKRSALAWSKGDTRPLVGQLEIEHKLTIGGHTFPIHSVNQPSAPHQAVLYTSLFGDSTRALQSGHECLIRKNRVKSICAHQANTRIPHNGYIYSIGKECSLIDIHTIKKGMQTAYQTKVFLKNKQGKTDITHKEYIVSGAGVLIRDGALVENVKEDFIKDQPITHCPDEIAADFSSPKERNWLITDRHPRTAIGILPDGKWLFVVADGRQPGYSAGASLSELAHFMLQKGCVEALNMGGGGCSTLVIAGAIINSPCGSKEHTKTTNQDEKRAHERPVCSAFIIK